MVRAKFQVSSVKLSLGYDGTVGTAEVELHPVTSGSEENKGFWKYTPNGAIRMSITNPDAYNQFRIGQEFYVDFTPAE